MAIPRIREYEISNETISVDNKVEWLPEANKAVLLIHDMQNYFVDFYNRNAEPMLSVVNNIKKLKELCKAANIPVIYSAQPCNQDPKDRALLTDFWGPGLRDDDELAKVLEEISPEEDDIVYTKWRYSAFQRTDLLKFLKEEKRDQLIICGIYAHIGILSTSLEAFMSDIKPFVISDAVADFSMEKHKMALEYVSGRCGKVVSMSELNSAISPEGNKEQLSLESMRKDVANAMVLPLDDVLADDNLMDLGLDSIRMMALVGKWQKQGTSIRFAELAEAATLEEWWGMIEPTLTGTHTKEKVVNG